MTRLIDADALIDAHYEACNKDKRKMFPSWSLRLMWDAPTVDAVPVVRCKECFMRADCKAAVFYGDDGYCSIGKKAGDAE